MISFFFFYNFFFFFFFFVINFFFYFFFFNDTATTEIYTLSLHDALPIYPQLSFATRMEEWTCLGRHKRHPEFPVVTRESRRNSRKRSEEHTSELQSPLNLVCRLLLEKKKQAGRSFSAAGS